MTQKKEIRVPDIGDFDKVPVIEVLVSEGDQIEKEQSLVTLESDKATMEVPSSHAGKLIELRIKDGDEVSEGDVIALIEVSDDESGDDSEDAGSGKDKSDPERSGADKGSKAREKEADKKEEDREHAGADDQRDSSASEKSDKSDSGKADSGKSDSGKSDSGKNDSGKAQSVPGWKDGLPPPPMPFDEMDHDPGTLAHASPSVRKLAREMGVDLKQVEGTGHKGRISEDDLKSHVKQQLSEGSGSPNADSGLAIAAAPQVDFSRFGDIEEEKLSRIKQISGPNLHRNWVSIPHVTQFDEADITEMEAFRKASQPAAEKAGTKLTPLVFLIKAVVASLKQFPDFNASLSNDGKTLIRKKYFHIGVAVDTPNGLMVPVLRDCDQKGLLELSSELTDLSGRAREGKLKGDEMKGGCFSISSLGGIGGTAFTPIINAPELAILGVSRAATKPVWDGDGFHPRLMLPLSLSYDHRVIDGAEAARFTRYLADQLDDLRRMLL